MPGGSWSMCQGAAVAAHLYTKVSYGGSLGRCGGRISELNDKASWSPSYLHTSRPHHRDGCPASHQQHSMTTPRLRSPVTHIVLIPRRISSPAVSATETTPPIGCVDPRVREGNGSSLQRSVVLQSGAFSRLFWTGAGAHHIQKRVTHICIPILRFLYAATAAAPLPPSIDQSISESAIDVPPSAAFFRRIDRPVGLRVS